MGSCRPSTLYLVSNIPVNVTIIAKIYIVEESPEWAAQTSRYHQTMFDGEVLLNRQPSTVNPAHLCIVIVQRTAQYEDR